MKKTGRTLRLIDIHHQMNAPIPQPMLKEEDDVVVVFRASIRLESIGIAIVELDFDMHP
jgi:hypothetical protein